MDEAVVFADDFGARLRLNFESGPADPDFVSARISFANGWVDVKSGYTFFSNDVKRFVRDLSQCHASLAGVARLPSEDGDFEVSVQYGARGNVTIRGHLKRYEDETTISFVMESDQSFVGEPLATLRRLI